MNLSTEANDVYDALKQQIHEEGRFDSDQLVFIQCERERSRVQNLLAHINEYSEVYSDDSSFERKTKKMVGKNGLKKTKKCQGRQDRVSQIVKQRPINPGEWFVNISQMMKREKQFLILSSVSFVMKTLSARFFHLNDKEKKSPAVQDSLVNILNILFDLPCFDHEKMKEKALLFLDYVMYLPSSQAKNDIVTLLLEVVEFFHLEIPLSQFGHFIFSAHSFTHTSESREYQRIVGMCALEYGAALLLSSDNRDIISALYWSSLYHEDQQELSRFLLVHVEKRPMSIWNEADISFLAQIYALQNSPFPEKWREVYELVEKNHIATSSERRTGKDLAEYYRELVIVNKYIEGFELDIYIPSCRLNIEIDGREFHKGAGKKIRAQIRDRHLSKQGITVMRLKDGQEVSALIRRIEKYKDHCLRAEIKKQSREQILEAARVDEGFHRYNLSLLTL
ncbi:hypothetical protein COB57_02175 [Candidatus Peregrinibacteria bacterium]|nr:MAG: hypothetical protein COB57_02175 [Candidatus Peregrinibacteria bacterium]